MSDKFKINWIEQNQKQVITCVTGYQYQIDDFKKTFFKTYPVDKFKTKIGTKLENSDSTITVIFIREKV